MSARVVDVADACVARLLAAWPPAVSDLASAERVWEFRAPDPERGLRGVDGRRVYVVPDGYDSPEAVTRAFDANDYRVKVLVVEVHPGGTDGVPGDWIDDRAAFVEAWVYAILSDSRAEPLALPGGGSAVAQAAEVTVVCDRDVLAEESAFWSESEFTFREYA